METPTVRPLRCIGIRVIAMTSKRSEPEIQEFEMEAFTPRTAKRRLHPVSSQSKTEVCRANELACYDWEGHALTISGVALLRRSS